LSAYRGGDPKLIYFDPSDNVDRWYFYFDNATRRNVVRSVSSYQTFDIVSVLQREPP
jgi:hypothetical protein